MLIGLPMLGIMGAGLPVSRYLEFPPATRYISHISFSWIAFAVFCIIILSALLSLVLMLRYRSVRYRPVASKQNRSDPVEPESEEAPVPGIFPWWGWAGILMGLLAWILAWTRFSWFAQFQPHTFAPLWLSYIIVINALDYRRTNRCLVIDRPVYFLLLFPTSAVFWWFFEYLNRFVQNWYYVGVQFPVWEYFWYATLSFSTVLPAVLSTREWIHKYSMVGVRRSVERDAELGDAGAILKSGSGIPAWIVLILSGIGLTGIGILSDYLFPLLWISPLLILVSLQSLMGEKHIFSDLTADKWAFLLSSAVAALVCGLFWEMWNYYSLAKWEYSIPFVHRFLIFEMPVLGYTGYLPFGLECAVIGEMIDRGRTGTDSIADPQLNAASDRKRLYRSSLLLMMP